jgi:hypothetical protein
MFVGSGHSFWANEAEEYNGILLCKPYFSRAKANWLRSANQMTAFGLLITALHQESLKPKMIIELS